MVPINVSVYAYNNTVRVEYKKFIVRSQYVYYI